MAAIATLAELDKNPELLEKISEQLEEHQRKKRQRIGSDESAEGEEQANTLKKIAEDVDKNNQKFDEITETLKLIITKLSKSESDLEDLNRKVDLNSNCLSNLKIDVTDLRQENKKEFKEIGQKLQAHSNIIHETKEQVKSLKKEVDNLKEERIVTRRKNIDQEARQRRNNLLFFGIEEEEKESNQACEDKMMSFFKDQLKLKEMPKVQRAHRLGQPRRRNPDGTRQKPRPIIACFSDYKEKEQVRSKRFDLNKPFGIAEDLPQEIRDARKHLQSKLEAEKRNGKRAAIIYPCRLISDGQIIDSIDVAEFSIKK